MNSILSLHKITSVFTKPFGDKAERAFKSRYHLFLAILTCSYTALYGWLLVSTDFLPYVIDNNESFSSYIHAKNMYQFGVNESFGLTDEAYGPNPAAHPYVYTHGGNFPRFYVFLLYILGIRSVESQIFIATFTIGAIAVFFAYHYFSKVTNELFAFIASLVLITDYIFFAQWQVNTWRVWHGFFFFSSLLCAHGLGQHKWRKLWLVLTFANYMGLFYLEFVFGAFVAVSVGLYTGYLYFRSWFALLRAWSIQVAGAVIGVLALILQLVAYLGWDSFVRDVQLTYTGRNAATSEADLLPILQEFYNTHNIVFWYNVPDSTFLRTPLELIRSLTQNYFQIYTPFLTLLILILSVGWLLSLSLWDRRLIPKLSKPLNKIFSDKVLTIVNFSLFCSSSFLFLVVIWRDQTFMGLQLNQSSPWQADPFLILVAGFSAIVGYLILSGSAINIQFYPRNEDNETVLATLTISNSINSKWGAKNNLPLRRVVFASVLMWGTAHFIAQYYPIIYDPRFQPLWLEVQKDWLPLWLNQLAVTLAMGIAVIMIVLGTEQILGQRKKEHLLGLVSYLISGFLAYSLIYTLSPGYVRTGYLIRLAPFAIFHISILIGLAIYIILKIGCAVLPQLSMVWEKTMRFIHKEKSSTSSTAVLFSVNTAVKSAGSFLIIGLFFFTIGYWLTLQSTYLTLLPPNHFAFLKLLKSPSFQGASFAVNNYAAPVAAYADHWAYYDPKIGTGDIQARDIGFVVSRDSDSYLWLADKQENPAYQKPDYFICMNFQDLWMVLAKLSDPSMGLGCSNLGIVKQTQSSQSAILQHQLVAKDTTGRDAWAIVKLDWDYPPYLKPLPEFPMGVPAKLSIDQRDEDTVARIDYEYAQQDGQIETDSIYRFYLVKEDRALKLLEETSDSKEFVLPDGLTGRIKGSVTPRSLTKIGSEYFSLDTVYQQGQWVIDTSPLFPINPNFNFTAGSETDPIPTWTVASGASDGGYEITRLHDETGPFIRLRATQDLEYLVIAQNPPSSLSGNVSLSLKAQIRTNSTRHQILHLFDQSAEVGDQRHIVSTESDKGKWNTLEMSGIHVWSGPEDYYALGINEVKAGDWFDVREFSLFTSWIP